MPADSSFEDIIEQLREDAETAEPLAGAIHTLSKPRYTAQVAATLLTQFGMNPGMTRILIRAAARSRSRELHDVLAQILTQPEGAAYAYELIDALSGTGVVDYAAMIIPFLTSRHSEDIRSTAAYALGNLQSPVAVFPLIEELERTRSRRLKGEFLRAVQAILSHASPESIDVYLAAAPKKVRDRIRHALRHAA